MPVSLSQSVVRSLFLFHKFVDTDQYIVFIFSSTKYIPLQLEGKPFALTLKHYETLIFLPINTTTTHV